MPEVATVATLLTNNVENYVLKSQEFHLRIQVLA